jgi:excisionase family DNA binding protein
MDFLTVNETAQLLRVSPITVRRYIASGRLAAERVGRGIRVRREAIDDFVSPIAPTAGNLKNGLDEDVVEIYSPLSPEGSVFVPNNDLLEDELPTMREVLGISIGIGRSGEPTNIAEHKDEYLADAFEAKR